MSTHDPMLAICDLVAWRLDLFERALRQAADALEPLGAFTLKAGYRLRDDLAFLAIEHSVLDADEIEQLIFNERSLPGLRRLKLPSGARTVEQAVETGFRSCEVVIEANDPTQISFAIRSAIGMERDQRVSYRLGVEVPLNIETPGGWLSAMTRDLSAGGVFIRTRQPLDLGETYPVEFFPDLTGLTSAHGMLTVVREENEGFGGRISLTEQGQMQMYRHLRALRLPDAASASMMPMTFEITKPMRAVRTQVTRVQEKLAEDIEEVLSAPRARALIAVGYEALRRQLALKLRRVGFEVLVSTSGMYALQTLVDELLALDVLILDEHLGDMTGIELLSHIRRAGGESTLPIVAMTDEDEGPSRTSLLEAGASATLPVRGVESMTHASLLSLLSRSTDRRPITLGAQSALSSTESDRSE